jgi:hypothetical protein
MAGSSSEAASAAVERLHALREQAKHRRELVKDEVRQVRERNHEESLQAMLRVRAARRAGPVWPTEHPEPQLHLYETDDLEPPAPQGGQAVRPAPAGPRRPAPQVDDDDWSNETWLH